MADKNARIETSDRGSKVTGGNHSNVVEVKCGTCSKELLRDKGIQCEICSVTYHITCINMTEETYNVIDLESLHWFCKLCDKRVVKLLKTMASIEERQDQLEKQIRKMQEMN